MPVYVDDMEAKFGRMIMCHMVADTHRELVEMADKIGVARHWIQKKGTVGEHFDIAKSKRTLAIQFGAVEISWADCGRREYNNRHNPDEFMRKYYELDNVGVVESADTTDLKSVGESRAGSSPATDIQEVEMNE